MNFLASLRNESNQSKLSTTQKLYMVHHFLVYT